jgi:hypothetical protein
MSPEKKWEKTRREPRLVREGEIQRTSNLADQKSLEENRAVSNENQRTVQENTAEVVVKEPAAATSALDRIQKDLKDSRSLQAAIYYSEIFSAPRAYRPYRPPHMR